MPLTFGTNPIPNFATLPSFFSMFRSKATGSKLSKCSSRAVTAMSVDSTTTITLSLTFRLLGYRRGRSARVYALGAAFIFRSGLTHQQSFSMIHMTRHPTSGEPSVVFTAFSRAYGFTLPAKGSEIFGVVE